MKLENFKIEYIIFHVSIHLLILLAIYFIFKPNFIGLVTAVFGTVIIDADHIFLIKKQGIAGYLSLRSNREFRKPRKYLFHNIYLIASFALFTPFIFSKQTFLIGIFAFSVFSHLLWDFLEDILIFHMNIKHWKL